MEYMSTRIYHGDLDPRQIANNLSATFHRGNYQVQQIGDKDSLAVQIATRQNRSSGGRTAMTATISKVADGLSITVGQQNWLGLAASLGFSALSAVHNPLSPRMWNTCSSAMKYGKCLKQTPGHWAAVTNYLTDCGESNALIVR